MSSFTLDDLAGLPRPEIIETLSVEAILAARKRRLVSLAPSHGLVYDLQDLETDPAVMLLEEGSYEEASLRARGNDIARARYLYYARGAEVDHLGAFYDTTRMDGEDDDRLKARIILGIQGGSTAGTGSSPATPATGSANTFDTMTATAGAGGPNAGAAGSGGTGTGGDTNTTGTTGETGTASYGGAGGAGAGPGGGAGGARQTTTSTNGLPGSVPGGGGGGARGTSGGATGGSGGGYAKKNYTGQTPGSTKTLVLSPANAPTVGTTATGGQRRAWSLPDDVVGASRLPPADQPQRPRHSAGPSFKEAPQ